MIFVQTNDAEANAVVAFGGAPRAARRLPDRRARRRAAAPPFARAPLAPGSEPAQIGFAPDGRTLVVTERGTNAIEVVPVDADGLPGEPVPYGSAGATPYGFDFAGGTLVVTEAFGGAVGAAAACSYRLDGTMLQPVSRSVGDGTVSRYTVGSDGSLELADAVAASTVLGSKGIRDAARSGDGRFLYALDADERKVFA